MTQQLVGLAEIAALLEVGRSRADQLVRTKGFPDPLAELSAGRVWKLVDVQAWIDGRVAKKSQTPQMTQIGANAQWDEHVVAQVDTYRLLRDRGLSRNQAAKATGVTYKFATKLDQAKRNTDSETARYDAFTAAIRNGEEPGPYLTFES
jgi:prophage regulatory protein